METTPLSTRESAAEAVLPSRLLPRVSFRSMMVLTAISAVVIAIVSAADQGGIYATAAAVGFTFLVGMAAILAILFLLSWSVSFLPKLIGITLVGVGFVLAGLTLGNAGGAGWMFFLRPIWLINFQLIGWFLILAPIRDERDSETDSPFADGQLPPQIMAPREPVN